MSKRLEGTTKGVSPRFNFRLSPVLATKFQDRAAKDGRPASEIVRELIEEYLTRNPEK